MIEDKSKGKNEYVVLLHMTNQGSQDSHEDFKMI